MTLPDAIKEALSLRQAPDCRPDLNQWIPDDDDLKKVLAKIKADLGTIKITSADDSSSEGTYSGQPGVKVGDRVKK